MSLFLFSLEEKMLCPLHRMCTGKHLSAWTTQWKVSFIHTWPTVCAEHQISRAYADVPLWISELQLISLKYGRESGKTYPVWGSKIPLKLHIQNSWILICN